MPKLPVFVSLGLLGVLAIAAALVVGGPRRGGTASDGEAFEPIRFTLTRGIGVTHDGRGQERVVRTADGWVARWEERGRVRTWPVDESTVRAAVRLLNERVSPEGAVSEAASAGDGSADWALVVVIEHETGEAGESAEGPTELRLAEPRVGGVADGVIRQGGGAWSSARVDAELFELFATGGPRAWRDPRVGARLEWEPERITVRGGPQGALVLEKQRGAWVSREPRAARCDPERVRAIVSAVAAARVLRFVDADVMERESLDTAGLGVGSDAVGVLRLETGGEESRVFEVQIGAESPRSATSRYARVEFSQAAGDEPGDGSGSGGWGPQVIEVDVDELAEAFPVLEQVASRTALGGEPLEVGAMTVRASESGQGLELSRRGVQWVDASGPAPAATQQFATGLTERLLTARASRVTGQTIPSTRVARIELLDYRGGSLGVCELGIVPAAGDGQRPVISIESEGFTRLYDVSVFPAEMLRWLAAPR